jgi:hypothetical protein
MSKDFFLNGCSRATNPIRLVTNGRKQKIKSFNLNRLLRRSKFSQITQAGYFRGIFQKA